MSGELVKALAHFDKYYSLIYSVPKWRSIRLSLLCNPKKMFILNTFSKSIDKVRHQLQKNGAKNLFDNVKLEPKSSNKCILPNIPKLATMEEFDKKTTQYVGDAEIFYRTIKDVSNAYEKVSINRQNVNVIERYISLCRKEMLEWERPELHQGSLEVFAYPRGVIKKNITVERDDCGKPVIYPIDGASVMSALYLNIQKGDRVLDMCAAPGGKSLIFMCMNELDELVCIEKSQSRYERLKTVMNTYCDAEVLREKVHLIKSCATEQLESVYNYFDKVLLDVPCSTDREAILNPKFSLFVPQNYKKRQNIYYTQQNLLRYAIQACKIGGDIVYSTCTLSPLQNDYIIAQVIHEINNNPDNEVYRLKVVDTQSTFEDRVKPKSDWLQVSAKTDKFHTQLGNMILPDIKNNYGPGYFCKIRKCPYQ